MLPSQSRRNGGAPSGCRERKGRKMDKIDGEKFKYASERGRKKLLLSKINELVKWANDIDIVINHLGIVEGDIITRIELLENVTTAD